MQKTFTFLLFVVVLILSTQNGMAQVSHSAKKKTKDVRVTREVKTAAPGTIKKDTDRMAPRLLTRDAIKMLSGDADYMKNVVILDEQFALDYNPIAGKTEEIMKMLADQNSKLSVADIIITYLPKVSFVESEEKSAYAYHAQLELLMSTYPSLLPSLGEAFNAAFQKEEVFVKAVNEVIEKGHFTKL